MLFSPATERRTGVIGRWLLPVLSVFVLVLVLAACGMTPTPSPSLPSPPPTRVPPTPSSLPIEVPQPTLPPAFTPTPISSPTPTPFSRGVGTACGLIEIRDGALVDPALTANVEECFWQAYQVCDVSQSLSIVHTSTKTPNYSGISYRLMNTGGRCTVAISGNAVGFIVDPTTGARTEGGAHTSGDYCMGMARDSLGDLLFLGCSAGSHEWDLMAP